MLRILVAAFLVGATVAQAAPEVSPRARMVASGWLAEAALAARGGGRALVTARIAGGAATLRAAGFEARPLSATVAAVRVSAPELRRLRALPGVLAVEERRLLYPSLDRAVPMTRAAEARAEAGLDGAGVLIGVVDTGADFRHPDLRNAQGRTRIAALLDVSEPDDGRHPELGELPGRLWLKDELDAALAAEAAGQTPAVPVTQKDANGHGTHVAGIAASGGLATGNGLPAGRYVGVAPGAELLVVQAGRGGTTFVEADVLAGCRFLIDYARRLGRPLVVNLSLGGPGGPHDGTSNLERALDELFPAGAPGLALVVAAGNEGGLDYHAAGRAVSGAHVLPIEVGKSAQAGALAVELWYTGALELVVEGPSGRKSAVVRPGAATGDAVPGDGKVTVDNASAGPREDGRSSAGVYVEDPKPGTWKLHLRGQAARYDAWILDSPPGAPFSHFTDHVASDERVALPATARNAISVGSVASRLGWTSADGMTVDLSRRGTIGQASGFSATGPTSDGRFVPDLLAPGEFIIAPLSADAPPDDPQSAFHVPSSPGVTVADDGAHGVLRGTSQAAPVVAGALALLFQAEPGLEAGRAREILRTSARGELGWSPRDGFGALDVLAALRLLRGVRGGAPSPATSTIGVSRDALPPGDDVFTVTVTPRDAGGVPLGPGRAVEIVASAGEPVGPVLDAGAGRYERAFYARAPRGTVVVVRARVDGVELAQTREVHLVLDRAEIGRPFVAGGGCALPGAPASGLGLTLVAIAIAARARARRRRSPPRA